MKRQIARYRRFTGWDYSKGASFFITIATTPRRSLFGKIVNGAMVLSLLGEKVREALEAMPRLNLGLSLFGYVVMPDHVHFNCALAPGLDEPLKTLGFAIRRFKNYTTALAKRSLAINVGVGDFALGPNSQPTSQVCHPISPNSQPPSPDGQTFSPDGQPPSPNSQPPSPDSQTFSPDGQPPSPNSQPPSPDSQPPSPDGQTAFGQNLWQQGYHDYILVSREMIDSTERYIAYNPLKWEVMYGTGGGLRVTEPLCSPRLAVSNYWKGVGNLALLGNDVKMVSLRVSREVASTEAIAKVVKRLEDAVDKGYVIISGFISKGERAVRDMLCRRPDARFIRMLPSCIPNRRFKPESAYVSSFAEGRYLEIGRGNDEREFGRGACLDINAEIIEIATACEGLSLYWKGDGPHVVARNDSAEDLIKGA